MVIGDCGVPTRPRWMIDGEKLSLSSQRLTNGHDL